jgi:hypothetical protein
MLFKNNCCHTYSIVLLYTNWHLCELFQDSVHTLAKPKDYINYILLSPILSNQYDPSQLSSQSLSHNYFAISFLSQYFGKSKLLNNHFSIGFLVWLCLYCMFMLYYFCVIALNGELRILLREVKDRDLQKGKWHTFFYLFLLLH